ncbi:nucleotidyltransferase substrate binding protein [Williamwhitmania taraxaci]|uniref:Nucleotidyltransferase substrate binding protein, HI0074 family n=1 Tax=Williamwhitmania taraxaci TaxID=1640674 RepID=A0A1G6GHC4_9BACT|nr:nucleotidyltransferase substrate binding protein [Williamwhitmania taraxaci]SDB81299.1 nucleotidyltransferase substrate binding protein, HI0074 family [Williamwhitmania taraxaci]
MEKRWEQRFRNYSKALSQMELFISKGELNSMEEQGLIKAFEYTFALAWKTLQDFLREQGYPDIAGPRPTIEQSFQDGYIADGEGWMRMQRSRNLTSHTYNEDTAAEIATLIKAEYIQLFRSLFARLTKEETSSSSQLFS